MISAKMPGIDDEQLYQEIADNRDQSDSDLLNALKPTVIFLYEEYLNTLGLCSPISWSSANSLVLKSNWEYLRAAAFAHVRPIIFQTTEGYCFLCGSARAGEIDHYLPRSIFPEYSILSLNLLPACHRCNNKKRTRYKTAGSHLFFHPYIMTSISKKQFLTADVTFNSTVQITYTLTRPPAMSETIFATITEHFEDLSLADLYQDEAVRHMSEQLNAYYQYYRSGGREDLSRYLRRDAQSFSVRRGGNHWKPVLLNALAASQKFCSGAFKLLGAEVPFE